MPPTRIASIPVFLLAIAVTTPAWAGDSPTLRAAEAGLPPGFCATLQQLVAAAANDFVSLRGKPSADAENMWAGTKRLPGGGDCNVFGGKPSSYVCTRYLGDAGDTADSTYQSMVSGLKDCLPGEWKTMERIDGTHARTTTSRGSAGASVRVISRDLKGEAYQVELWVDGRP